MEERYLTLEQLSEVTHYKKQSLYNMIHKGVFECGKHYLKPSSKKILFRWSAIQEWLGEELPEHK